jgi:hypothetical protein
MINIMFVIFLHVGVFIFYSPPCVDDASDLNIAATAFIAADIDCSVPTLLDTAVTTIVPTF